MLRKKRRLSSSEDNDPLAGISNLSDAMLVLALGFLIFAIMAVSANPEMVSDTTSSSSSEKVSTGESFSGNDSNSGDMEDNGYSNVGTVYKDPNTGELILVSN